MEQSSNHKKQFTAEDIERYHAGTMAVDERHALEKAALDDPFLADALEGYAYAITPADDLAQLKKRLVEKTNNRKVVPFYSKTWVKVAALVLIIAGSGWFIFNTTSHNNKAIALEQKPQPHKETITTPVPQQVDSAKVQQEPKAKPETETAKVTVPLRSSKGDRATKEKITTSNATITKDETKEVALKPSTAETTESFNNLVKQKEGPDKTKAAAPVTNNAAPAARSFFKSQNKLDSTSSANNENISFSTANAKDTIHNLNVVLKPLADSNMAEVIVVGYGKARKQSALKEQTIIDTLEPAGGWSSFDDYIVSNLKSPEELQIKPVSGEVSLSFDVNKDGEPVNIKVEKSLCDKCDQEAIRLLKEGPKWKYKKNKNKKGKITIRF